MAAHRTVIKIILQYSLNAKVVHVKSSSISHLLENSNSIINSELLDFYETTQNVENVIEHALELQKVCF